MFDAEYMLTQLKIEESQVPDMCLDLYREHGTTMAGLKVNTFIDTFQHHMAFYQMIQFNIEYGKEYFQEN